ncbi:MAG: hypothetical protein ABSE18_02935 [Minisyncoccia bacterium]|jgi:hypothetical protein
MKGVYGNLEIGEVLEYRGLGNEGSIVRVKTGDTDELPAALVTNYDVREDINQAYLLMQIIENVLGDTSGLSLKLEGVYDNGGNRLEATTRFAKEGDDWPQEEGERAFFLRYEVTSAI